MRLPSIDFGSTKRHREKMPSVSTSGSSRSLASVLRQWPEMATGTQSPIGGGTLPSRSSSSRSLASKLSRAFVARKETSSLDISAPISNSVMHPGLALSEFGTPVRTDGGWMEVSRSHTVYPIGGGGWGRYAESSVELSSFRPPTLPDIPNTSSPMGPLLTPGRSPSDRSTLGSPYSMAPSPTTFNSKSSPRFSTQSSTSHKSSIRHQHTRHMSAPGATILSLTRPSYGMPDTPPTPQVTPTHPRNILKRTAFYERESQPIHCQGFEPPPGRSSPSPPSSLACSTTSSQFKIRRKPVPRLDIDTSVAGVVGSRQPSDSSAVSNRSVSEGRSSISSRVYKASLTSIRSPLLAGVSPSILPAVPHSASGNQSFQREMDSLFDNLIEECRSFSPQSTPTRLQHQRTVSLQPSPPQSQHQRTMSLETSRPGSNVPLLSRIRPAGKSSANTLTARPGFKILDNVDENDTEGSEDENGKENSDLATPRPKHHRVKDLRPFFPSGRSFEPIRGVSSPGPGFCVPPLPPVPTTPTRTNRVQTAVRGIEHGLDDHDNVTPVGDYENITPVSKLGKLLQQKMRVDSSELTLESKRMMEETRRRRANTFK